MIEVEGEANRIDIFVQRVRQDCPASAEIQTLDSVDCSPKGFSSFEIRPSEEGGAKTVWVVPDLATCALCREEVLDPKQRRYRYPFTNCASCGPRFSLVESLPYDRNHTTMKRFPLCAECRQEYQDPADRRFHAQPIACAACGPHLELWDGNGRSIRSRESALLEAARAIQEGHIVAVKGLGGFQLMVDATNTHAIQKLRARKHRPEKPFAVMFPELTSLTEECEVSLEEKRLFLSATSPIVLVKRKRWALPSILAPENPWLGALLPTTPLHVLLLKALGVPVVATSGNLSEEPICTDEHEALTRLKDVADFFLVHNRGIVQAMDDSVAKVVMGRVQVLRGARGYAPLKIPLEKEGPALLAVGGHLKNTLALMVGHSIVASQHLGDLDSEPALKNFQKTQKLFFDLYQFNPQVVVCDSHPDYLSTHQAEQMNIPVIKVQHHHTHIVSCMAEHRLEGPVLGVSWDGSGHGGDGSLWGGEFLCATRSGYERVGFFRRFRLPGGEQAVHEPRRAALGVLYEIFGREVLAKRELMGPHVFSQTEWRTLVSLLMGRVNSPQTSSVGRLFDAVASIVNLRHKCSFEGQAALALESVAMHQLAEPYPFLLNKGKEGLYEVDWEPLVLNILSDLKDGRPVGVLSRRFHQTLAKIILEVAKHVGEKRVVLSGGCFQNGLLLEQASDCLQGEGYDVYWPSRIPPNDGGLSIGQAAIAAKLMSGLGMTV
ncbi:MAG: Carbamoyltransferase HypF [Elusimicrobia bacterium]|nr:Carbamoyltransferase HypF [Elusimicrobiota bacterium]